jgi:hypothetical protein
VNRAMCEAFIREGHRTARNCVECIWFG